MNTYVENKNEPQDMDISSSTENLSDANRSVNTLTATKSQLCNDSNMCSSSMSLCTNYLLPLSEVGMGTSMMLQLTNQLTITFESQSKGPSQTNGIEVFDSTQNENRLRNLANMKKIFLEEAMKCETTTDKSMKKKHTSGTSNEGESGPVYQKCLSLDGNHSRCLDLIVFDKFKKIDPFRDVIEARKKRQMVKDDQNIEAPDIRFLLENKMMESRDETIIPTVDIPEELFYYYPLSMGIEYLLWNKISTEYTMWSYFSNFFYIGAIAFRHNEIPSIRIHVKFDMKGPKRSDDLGIPLFFNKVFVEECPIYMKKMSAKTYLKHQHALALLPRKLIGILSNSNNIFKALEQMDEWFSSAVAKVNEMDILTIECGSFLKMDGRECYIEKVVYDEEKFIVQEFQIKLAKIDDVGPKNVFFYPACETTDEFKNLSIGLPFLRAFLSNPKQFLVPFVKNN